MEHLQGGDLARRLREPLPREQALSLLRQAAGALAQLHRQGLVHRDVKPANFLLRADGSLVLADFGLVAEAGQQDVVPGTLVGTPRYVAPEQLQGAPAAPAADVYGLGVLLYEMLCGRPPFAGETLAEVLAQHLVATPAPLPAALADLQPLADRMLAREVHTRLPDADAVLGLMGQRC
jgi:serine/threonine protein kinase